MPSCAGSLRPVTAAEPTAACSGTRRWSNAPHREPSSSFGDRLSKWRCWRSEVITLPRRHALDDWPRSGPRQASALHSSPSFCPTFCGPITALRHCRLRWGNPSRASTASADPPWAANPSGASALTRQVAPRLPAHSGQQHDPARSPQKKLCRAVRHSAPTAPQVMPDGHYRAATAGDSRAGPTL